MVTSPAPDANPPPPSAATQRPRTLRWVALGLAVVAVAFVVVLATRDSAQEVAANSPLLGKIAPEVTGRELDGRTVRLSQFRGRYVLMNFFATWCTPCLREHDDLMRFQGNHTATGDATVLGVIFDDDPDNVRRFFEQRGGDWPVITDDSGKVSLDFGVRGPPESFLISPEGIVLTRIIGGVDSGRLENLLAQAEALRSQARSDAEIGDDSRSGQDPGDEPAEGNQGGS